VPHPIWSIPACGQTCATGQILGDVSGTLIDGVNYMRTVIFRPRPLEEDLAWGFGDTRSMDGLQPTNTLCH
jgi:hypothetical protein